jgi:hypothetical protein
VNAAGNNSIVDPARATKYNNPMAMAKSDQVSSAGFNNTFYNQNKVAQKVQQQQQFRLS